MQILPDFRRFSSFRAVLWIGIVFDADPDPDPTFHFDADPDPDPNPDPSPTPSFTHVGKSEQYLLTSSHSSASALCLSFLSAS